MQNETISRQNRVLAPIILAITIVVAILILRPVYAWFIEKNALITQNISTLESRTTVYNKLLEIRAMFDSGATSDLQKKVDQLDRKFNVSDIMETVMLNLFTKANLSEEPKISIGTISVSKWSKLPNGLSFWQVSIDVTGWDMYDVIDFITYLTTNSPYAFTIDSISLPLDTDPEVQYLNGSKFSLSLSLGMYYYE